MLYFIILFTFFLTIVSLREKKVASIEENFCYKVISNDKYKLCRIDCDNKLTQCEEFINNLTFSNKIKNNSGVFND
ncbi:MAG: hypothetical protein QXX68_03550 [Candidatus Pacearchaeota archaeon]